MENVSFAPAPTAPGMQLPEVYDSTAGRGMDQNLDVRFYRNPRGEGDRVTISPRGDLHLVVDRIVTEDDKQRFAGLWAAYEEGRDASAEGTPLSEVTWLDPATVAMLSARRVFTVEQLANINETAVEQSGIMGLGYLRQAAQTHLERTARALGLDTILGNQQKLMDRIQELENALAETPRPAAAKTARQPAKK